MTEPRFPSKPRRAITTYCPTHEQVEPATVDMTEARQHPGWAGALLAPVVIACGMTGQRVIARRIVAR